MLKVQRDGRVTLKGERIGNYDREAKVFSSRFGHVYHGDMVGLVAFLHKFDWKSYLGKCALAVTGRHQRYIKHQEKQTKQRWAKS